MDKSWSVQTRYLLLVIFLLLLAALIYYARSIIGPLIIAAFLAYVLDPIVSFVMRHLQIGKRVAVPFVYLLFLANLVAIPALLTPVLLAQLDTMSSEIRQLQLSIGDTYLGQTILGFTWTDLEGSADVPGVILQLLRPEQIFGVFLAATENLAWILVIFVATYYFLLDGDRLKHWMFRLVPYPYQTEVRRLHNQIKDVWQAYLRGQLLLMLIMGFFTGILVFSVGLPDALLIGILTGILDIIPSIGPAIAMVVAAALAYFAGSTYLPISNFWFTVLVVAIFITIQFVENVWLRPRILGHRLHLHPAVVFVAIIGALVLAGVLVALIIVPIIRTAEILGRYTLRRIFGLDPWSDYEIELGEPSELDHTVSLEG